MRDCSTISEEFVYRDGVRGLDERLRRADMRWHRTYRGPLCRFGVDRHSPGVLILPALVCALVFEGTFSLSMRSVYAILASLAALLATAWLTARARDKPLWMDLAIQIAIVGAACGLVWGLGADTFQRNSVYRHLFVLVTVILLIGIAFAAWLAERLFRDLRQQSEYPHYLPRTELFASYGPEREKHFWTYAVSAFTAPLRGPLQLLFLPAMAAVTLPPHWLTAGLWVAVAIAVGAAVISGVDDRFSTMWKLFQSGFFRGGALIVSLAVILFGVLRIRDVSYVKTVLDTAAGQVIVFMLASAYVLSWWYDYWVSRLLSEQILRLLKPDAGLIPSIDYPIDYPKTSVPADGRAVQIHGASRFIAIRPPDRPGYVVPAPAAANAANLPYCAQPRAERADLRRVTCFQSYRVEEMIALLASSGAPGGKAVPLPSQIMARVFSYHGLVALVVVVLGALGIWGLHAGPQLPELAAKTSAQPGVSLASFLFERPAQDAGRPILVIAASGGGTRAALYTASVLAGLHERNEDREVVLGSGISGGGAALAYFASRRNDLVQPGQPAWDQFFEKMQEPFIRDVLERASEWRIVSEARLGTLLSDSFIQRWGLPSGRQTLGEVRDFGLILNTAVAGSFDRADAPAESREGSLMDVERRNRKLTHSELAGGRLILTNLQLPLGFTGEAVEGKSRHPLPIVVDDPRTRLETAAALNANFPPVFSDAAVDVDDNMRYWVTDGGAVDNRGMEMLLYAIRDTVVHSGGRRLPRLHVIVADASAYSNQFSQDRGAATMAAAGTQFASQLASELSRSIREKYEQAGQKEDYRFWYLSMPTRLRTSGSFGTHWMLQPSIRIEGDVNDKPVTLKGQDMVDLLRILYTADPGAKLSPNAAKVLSWSRRDVQESQWPQLLQSLAAPR